MVLFNNNIKYYCSICVQNSFIPCIIIIIIIYNQHPSNSLHFFHQYSIPSENPFWPPDAGFQEIGLQEMNMHFRSYININYCNTGHVLKNAYRQVLSICVLAFTNLTLFAIDISQHGYLIHICIFFPVFIFSRCNTPHER